MRINAELYNLYKEPDIVTSIKQGRINVGRSRTKNDRGKSSEKVLIGGPGGRKASGRSKRSWVDDFNNNLRRLFYNEFVITNTSKFYLFLFREWIINFVVADSS